MHERWPDLGPLRHRALPVPIAPEAPMPIGMALAVGWESDPRVPDEAEPSYPPLATFRLVIGGAELPGRWVVVGRRFEPARGESGRLVQLAVQLKTGDAPNGLKQADCVAERAPPNSARPA